MDIMRSTLQFSSEDSYVLAVDDSLVQAKRLEYFFKMYDIKYQLFTNGEDAYQAALVKKPDLVISDIVMPGMDGYELCEKLKALEGYSTVPVILLTSLQDPQDIIRGLQAGADNFITKPYKDKYLFLRIQHLLINRDYNGLTGGMGMVIEMMFRGEKYLINSDKKQILDLLLSVYEAAIQRNEELIDITAKLETANEMLRQANQDLDSFARTVSHDLQNPLNGVIGIVGLLIHDESYNLSQEAKDMLIDVHKSSWAMSSLIKDLLDFARSGEIEVAHEPINLSVIAEDVMCEVLKRDVDRKVKVTIQPDMNANADPKLMRVVLNNLFGNAFKFSGNREEAEIVFGIKDYCGSAHFFVQDNGAGFDMEKASSLFQPFQRLHTSKEFKGTGLGLSIVKRILEKHGGQISVESVKDVGTTFLFTLGN